MSTHILTQEEEKQKVYDLRKNMFKDIASDFIYGNYNERMYNTIFDLEDELIHLEGKHIVLDLVNKKIVGSFDNDVDAMKVAMPGKDMMIWRFSFLI